MRRTAKLAIVLVAGLAAAIGPVNEASATLPMTTVSPAGDYVLVKLPPGGKITEKVSTTTTTCTQFAFRPPSAQGTNVHNQIPTADNPSAAGPVTIPLTHPVIGKCTVDQVGLTVTASTSGTWAAIVQHDAGGGNSATVRMPKGGLVGQTSGLASCTFTAAPDGPVLLAGTWVNGSTGPSKIKLVEASVPVNVSGAAPCPTGPHTGSISVNLNVTDVTNDAATVTAS